MFSQSDIKLDSFINKATFFNPPPKVKELDIALPFEMPTSIGRLSDFMFSEAGDNFVAGVKGFLEQIHEWASDNGIQVDEDAFDSFLQHFNYSADSNDVLKYALYTEGVTLLAGVVNEMQSDNVPIEKRKDCIQNLITGLQVCAPGAYTNISEAYLQLTSNPSLIFTEIKYAFAKQAAMEALNESKIIDNVGEDMELHYANFLTNKSVRAIGIGEINDPQTKELGSVSGMSAVVANYGKKLKSALESLTPEAIIENVIEKLDTNSIAENLSHENYSEKVKLLENSLNQFGPDPLFNLYHVMDEHALEEGEIKLKSKEELDHNLAASLLRRLGSSKENQIFNLGQLQEANIPNSDNTIHFIPNHSLKLAYVSTDSSTVPMIPFLKQDGNALMACLNDKNLSKMVDANALKEIVPHADELVKKLQSMSSPLNAKIFCGKLSECGHLKSLVHNFSALKEVVSSIPQNTRMAFLIQVEHVDDIVHTKKQKQELISHFDPKFHQALEKHLERSHEIFNDLAKGQDKLDQPLNPKVKGVLSQAKREELDNRMEDQQPARLRAR
jgi:hypothetical protein